MRQLDGQDASPFSREWDRTGLHGDVVPGVHRGLRVDASPTAVK